MWGLDIELGLINIIYLRPRHQSALHLAPQPQVQVGRDLVLVLDSEYNQDLMTILA